MALGYTADFSTSAMRPYTGPTGGGGANPRGHVGHTGNSGGTGERGPNGLTGVTGTTIIGTFLRDTSGILDPNYTREKYMTIQFADGHGNIFEAKPVGLTGPHGSVAGTTGYFSNVGNGNTAVYVAVTWGTQDPNKGICGATLSFRRIGASGDFVLYTDESNKIGPGPTYEMLGISASDASILYGSVTGHSVGELAYLVNPKDVKDGFGLTFTDRSITVPPGPATSLDVGLTWGTIAAKWLNHNEFYSVHGYPGHNITGDLTLNTADGNVHLLYPPFNLSGITAEFHSLRNPIARGPMWKETLGASADYGEAISVTLIIDGGPHGISFGGNFYFDRENIPFTQGRDILNCLSYDHGTSWLVTSSGFGYGISGPEENSIGSCCNSDSDSPNFGKCFEYIAKLDCEEQGTSYHWYSPEQAPNGCSDTPCATIDIEGSCCLNKTSLDGETLCVDGATRNDCESFGGNFRPATPCGDINYPCGDPCDTDFFKIGACCIFDDFGNFVECRNSITALDCVDLNGIYQGDDMFCVDIDCMDVSPHFGACCLPNGACLDSTRPLECLQIHNGVYMGTNSDCLNVNCSCEGTPRSAGGNLIQGACCVGNSCIVCSESTCVSSGGNYQGNNAECINGTCGTVSGTGILGKCCENCNTCSHCSSSTIGCECVDSVTENDCVSLWGSGGVWSRGENCPLNNKCGDLESLGCCCLNNCSGDCDYYECISENLCRELDGRWIISSCGDCSRGDVCKTLDAFSTTVTEPPTTRQAVSGFVCVEDDCSFIGDYYDYILSNGLAQGYNDDGKYLRFIPAENSTDGMENRGMSMESGSICFPNIPSPSNTDCMDVVLPAGTCLDVARGLGGIGHIGVPCSDVNCSKIHKTKIKKLVDIFGGKLTELKGERHSDNGMCTLPNGTVIDCDEDYCRWGLGGSFVKNTKIDKNKYIQKRDIRGGIVHEKTPYVGVERDLDPQDRPPCVCGDFRPGDWEKVKDKCRKLQNLKPRCCRGRYWLRACDAHENNFDFPDDCCRPHEGCWVEGCEGSPECNKVETRTAMMCCGNHYPGLPGGSVTPLDPLCRGVGCNRNPCGGIGCHHMCKCYAWDPALGNPFQDPSVPREVKYTHLMKSKCVDPTIPPFGGPRSLPPYPWIDEDIDGSVYSN
jgi:hypothetical protein